MINSVSNSSMMQPPPQMNSSVSLTDEQKETVNTIISQYDSENMSSDDFESMITELKEAGIPPSEDLFSAMDEAGFEKPEGAPPPPPPGGAQKGGEVSSELFADLTSQLENGEITEDEFQSMLQSIKAQSQSTEGNFIDGFA